jgi:hypothetical protein
MRQSLVVFLVAVFALSGSARAQAQGVLQGAALGVDRAALSNFRVQVRNANTGELAGSTPSNQAGQFSFGSLQPGNYVGEIVDAAGKVVGLSESLSVAVGATVTVTVGATAAGALVNHSGSGSSLLDLGSLASVAVTGSESGGAATPVIATPEGKLVVCHQMSSSSSLSLKINESARDGHVGHGDTLGACPAKAGR